MGLLLGAIHGKRRRLGVVLLDLTRLDFEYLPGLSFKAASAVGLLPRHSLNADQQVPDDGDQGVGLASGGQLKRHGCDLSEVHGHLPTDRPGPSLLRPTRAHRARAHGGVREKPRD